MRLNAILQKWPIPLCETPSHIHKLQALARTVSLHFHSCFAPGTFSLCSFGTITRLLKVAEGIPCNPENENGMSFAAQTYRLSFGSWTRLILVYSDCMLPFQLKTAP